MWIESAGQLIDFNKIESVTIHENKIILVVALNNSKYTHTYNTEAQAKAEYNKLKAILLKEGESK